MDCAFALFHKHWKFNFLFLICPSLEGKIILSAGVNVLYKFWTDKTLDISESERKGWRSHSFLKNSKTYSIYLDLKWDTSKRLIQFQTKTLQNIPSGKRKHQSLCVMKYRLRDLVNWLLKCFPIHKYAVVSGSQCQSEYR